MTYDHAAFNDSLHEDTIVQSTVQSTVSSVPEQLSLEFAPYTRESSDVQLDSPKQLEPVYATWAPIYGRRGYNHVPIRQGTKRCSFACWYVLMTDVDFEVTLRSFPDRGNGLLIDSVFPDGTKLAALDVAGYIPLALALMEDTRSVKRGVKGLGIFILPNGEDLGNVEFRVKGEFGQASLEQSEALGTRNIRVVAPEFYPNTRRPNPWCGPALHEISFEELSSFENCSTSASVVNTQVLDCMQLRRAGQYTQNIRPSACIDGMKTSSSREDA